MTIRILLTDDHQIIREGLRHLLNAEADMEVVAEAEDGRKAVQLVGELSPDVVIMDIAMPDLNGTEATRQILSMSPHTRVIALSMHSDRRFVSEMLNVGAKGYLLKDCAFEELVGAIRTVSGDKVYLSPEIASLVVEEYRRNQSPQKQSSVYATLTPREREVLQLMAEGHSTKEIAQRLHVSVKTIETHRQQIMSKLDLHNMADLTKYAIREGLTSLEGR